MKKGADGDSVSPEKNPFDQNEVRSKMFPLKVNDYDLFELKRKAQNAGLTQSALLRRGAGMPDVKPGARVGNKNAEKQTR